MEKLITIYLEKLQQISSLFHERLIQIICIYDFFQNILKKNKCSEDSDQIIVFLQAEMKVYFNSLRNLSDSDKVVFMINRTPFQQ